jgi:peptide chain release factor 2
MVMADYDFPAEIRATHASIEQVTDAESLRAEIAELSEAAGAPGLWDDPSKAQQVTSRLSHRQSELERLERLGERIDDLEVLVELARRGATPIRSPRRPRNSLRSAMRSRTSSS